jgi:chromosome segregation ATPase
LQKAIVKFKDMDKECEESKVLIRSLRSNQQAENDRHAKTIRDAEAPKDVIIARLEKEYAELEKERAKLDRDRIVDERNIRELSGSNLKQKETNAELLAHAQALEEVNRINAQELCDLRAKVANMEVLQGVLRVKEMY